MRSSRLKMDGQISETSARAAAEDDQVVPSRRTFLTRAAGVSAVAVPTLTLLTRREARAGGSNKLTGLNAELINEIMNDENQHVPIIQNLLNDPDNPLPIPIRQPPNFNMQRLVQPNLQDFLETASVFENTGSGLYHGALLNVTQTQEYFPTAAGLASVEARHAAWLNSLLGESLVPDFAPVEAPIDQSITLSRLAEFVTDPRSTFPSFDTTVATDANNFFVLDFILFLEYIESTFYRVNVPRFT
jgi:Ferritin-like domain